MVRNFILLLIVSLLAATPAFAADPPTVILPTALVLQIRQYLGTQPYDATARLIAEIEGCVRVQVPVNGVVMSHGECPDVTAALAAARPKPVEAATKPNAPNPKH